MKGKAIQAQQQVYERQYEPWLRVGIGCPDCAADLRYVERLERVRARHSGEQDLCKIYPEFHCEAHPEEHWWNGRVASTKDTLGDQYQLEPDFDEG